MSKVKKKKTFGDTTSFTIPATGKFIDIKTNKERSVTPEMLHLVNEHIDRRTLGHAIMSFLYWQAHGNDTQPEYERLEGKIDEVLEMLKGGAAIQSAVTESSYPDDTDELLSEHFG
ncbi:hypothetical protein [Aneurinibacillus aneurinilyticus]|uniref:hypothetical protein n=1 Tax=Aneurinibacillus aneurinilyticus TaxID=1391 RepID=UPI0023F302A0|nr:hypothetical protein [Aneurinibacillus aneurinilyticus]